LAKTLERNLASDLPVSWKLLTDRLPKRPISQVGIHKQIGMIKQIVELKPQLEIDPLSDPCVLVGGQIRLGETWLPELLCLFIPIGARCWSHKLSRGEDTIKNRTSGGRLVVAHHIGIIQVISICVVVATSAEWGRRKNCKWIPCLVDLSSTHSPASSQQANSALAIMQSRHLVVEGKRKAIGNIPWRWPVELMRI